MQPSGTSKFQIGPARAQDFDELMDMLATCFRIADPDHPRIEEIFPDIYKPRELEMSWNLVARDKGTIVGCVTVVPVAISIGSKIIEICAIGGVGTLRQYRGRGIMQQLMDLSTVQMCQGGYGFVWLAGDRRRYRPWGYEPVPNIRQVQLTARGPGIEKFLDLQGWKTQQIAVNQTTWDSLWSQARHVQYFAPCGSQNLKLKYCRPCADSQAVLLASNDTANGHVLLSKDHSEILAWAGDPQAVGVAIARHIVQHPCNPTVLLPAIDDGYSEVFNKLRRYSSVIERGNMAILNLGAMLETFKAHLDSRVRSLGLNGQARLIIGPFRQVPQQAVILTANGREITILADQDNSSDLPDVHLDCWETVELFFSRAGIDYTERLGANAAWIAALGPLPFYFPQLWAV